MAVAVITTEVHQWIALCRRSGDHLYVLDGALMPGTTAACNASMTIAAIAERAMEKIVRDDVGTRI